MHTEAQELIQEIQPSSQTVYQESTINSNDFEREAPTFPVQLNRNDTAGKVV
jgi:hypothetical protein